MRMDHAIWLAKYTKMKSIADRIAKYRAQRAREVCKAAGLDPSLLGIHPHNAMVAMQFGHPWDGVDYSLVRKCLWILDHQFDGHRIVEAWDKRVRGF